MAEASALIVQQQIIINGKNKKEAITKRYAVRCSCVCRDVTGRSEEKGHCC